MLVQLKFNFLHKMSKSSNIASARVKKDGLSQKNSSRIEPLPFALGLLEN